MNDKKRVAFISLNYYPSSGGLVRYIDSFGGYLISEGYEVDVFCSDAKNGELARTEVINEINVFRFSIYNFPRFLKIFTPLIASRKFFNELNKVDWARYDLVVIRHLYGAYSSIKIKDLKFKSVYICPLASARLQLINSKSRGLWYKAYSFLMIPQLYFMERVSLNNHPRTFSLSKSKKVELEKYFNTANPLQVVQPAVSRDTFRPSDLEEMCKIRSFFNVQHDDFVFCTVCRLVEEKNVQLLINAFSRLLESKPRSTLIIAGDGPLRFQLENQVAELGCEESVRFVGFVNNPEIVYQGSDCFVLPSLYEGFGHVYLEANSCGIPVIGLGNNPPEIITATDEIIENGENGIVVKDSSVPSLVKAMNEVMAMYTQSGRDYVVQQCVNHVSHNFSWRAHLNTIRLDYDN